MSTPEPTQSGAVITPGNYLTQSQLAAELQISERTLERMRCDGSGPLFKKAGRRVLYARADVDAWLDSQTFSSTAEMKLGGNQGA